jgi:hypothetical protein
MSERSERWARPPETMLVMSHKMPRKSHAMFLVVDGKVENPEFVVWTLKGFREELWKWKRKDNRVAGNHIEYWAKHDRDFYRFNINEK